MEAAFAHEPATAMIFIGGFLLIPGAIAASIAKEKRIWWFLASIPLMVVAVLWAFSTTIFNPYLVLSLPLILIPLAIWQNKRLEVTTNSEEENVS